MDWYLITHVYCSYIKTQSLAFKALKHIHTIDNSLYQQNYIQQNTLHTWYHHHHLP